MLAIAIGGTDDRLQLHLSTDQLVDPIELRQRVVYFAKRMVAPASFLRPIGGKQAEVMADLRP